MADLHPAWDVFGSGRHFAFGPEAVFTLVSEDCGNKCPDLAPANSGAKPGHKEYPDFAPLSPSYGRLSKQFMARHSIQRSADRTKPIHDFAHA